MKYNNFILLCLIICICISCAENPKPIIDNRKSDYALYDVNGDFHRLSYHND